MNQEQEDLTARKGYSMWKNIREILIVFTVHKSLQGLQKKGKSKKLPE